MKAIAKCKECGQKLKTECRTCIEAKVNYHRCESGYNVVKEIDWKIVPQGFKDD